MGYFSNGTEGMMYEAMWCDKCHHRPEDPMDGDCAVWQAQMLYNYDLCNEKKNPLNILIPRSKEDLGNEQCRMFLPRQGRLPGEPKP